MPIALAIGGYGIIVIDEDGNLLWTWKYINSELPNLRMYGLDVHPETGNFFVTTFNEILEVSRTGRIVWRFSSNETYDLHSLQVLPNGNILTACTLYDRVLEINKKEGVVWRWDAADHYKAPPGHETRMRETYDELQGYRWTHLNHAWRLPDGDTLIGMYYAPEPVLPNNLPDSEQSDGCFVLVDPAGCIKWEWGRKTTKFQHFIKPHGQGFLVADSLNKRLLHFVWPKHQCEYPLPHVPLGLDFHHGRVIITFPQERKVWLNVSLHDMVYTEYTLPDSIPGKPYTPKYLPMWSIEYSPEEKEIIEARLRDLGYIE